ncbi:MAG: 16S rRNA (guanine(966)-N(2))-methyltransferase RsmD [Epsilonproteobacteria bacterium]|nr:16S rRNA (guanine(966)-N(2))-methyltransferase RsmD [Campylobacterota bacterium]
MRGKKRLKEFKIPIISGKYKGKRISIPDTPTTRSSKSILRESLFNTLQQDIIGLNFVEVFAGSGSVGLEALSRGANEVYFIEKDRDVYNILKKNIEIIDKERSKAYNSDSFEIFDTIYNNLKEKGIKSIFYFDPPFNIREGMEDIYKKSIDLIEKLKDDFVYMVIVEHFSQIEFPQKIGNLIKIKSRKFGKSTLSYYKREDNE